MPSPTTGPQRADDTQAPSQAATGRAARPTGVSSSSGRRVRRSDGAAHAVLVVASLVMVFPFVWQLLMSISTNFEIQAVPVRFFPEVPQWRNYVEVFTKLPFLSQLGASVLITVTRTLGQLVLCSLAGYAFARMRLPFKGALLALILAILMVPGQVYLIPQYQIIRDLNLLETPWGVALPGIFSAFGTFLMRQSFMSLPRELEESARLDGASPWQTFWQIMLPLARPGLSAVTITTVLWSWNDLLWPLIVTTRETSMPLSAGIATLAGRNQVDYSVMMAASALAMAPVLLLFLALQKRVVEGLAFSGMKG